MTVIALPPTPALVDLVGTLGGFWHGYSAMCRCPAHTDHTPSLSLRQGTSRILVHCFAGCEATDVLRALRLIEPRTGFVHPGPALASSASSHVRLWTSAMEVRGTLAERYLAQRRLDPAPGSVRFLRRCPRGPKPRTRFEPALLIPVYDSHHLRAIQRIFLDPTTGRYSTKMMLGRPRAGAWQGTPVGTSLGLAEGFEDAVAFTALTGIPCWAALGASRLHLVRFPPCVREIALAHDNDAEGLRAAQRAIKALAQHGIAASSYPPPRRFHDWAEAREAA